jgi:hypothetical protein
MEVAVGRGFSSTGVDDKEGLPWVGDIRCATLERLEAVVPCPIPLDERNEFMEAFRKRVGVPKEWSRPWDGLRVGGRAFGAGDCEIRRLVGLKGEAGAEERRVGTRRRGEVEMDSWFNDLAKSSCSGCLRFRAEDCRRSGSDGRDGDAMRSRTQDGGNQIPKTNEEYR